MKWYQYPFSCIVQSALCKIGIAVHNPFRDECTHDFGCCAKHLGHYWLRIDAHHLPIRRDIEYVATAPKGTPGRKFKEVRKYKLWFQK